MTDGKEMICTGMVATRVNDVKKCRESEVLKTSEQQINSKSRKLVFDNLQAFFKHHGLNPITTMKKILYGHRGAGK